MRPIGANVAVRLKRSLALLRAAEVGLNSSFVRPCQASRMAEGSKATITGPYWHFIRSRQPEAESGRMSEQSHRMDVLDGWKMPCNSHGTLPYFKRQALVPRQLDKEAARP